VALVASSAFSALAEVFCAYVLVAMLVSNSGMASNNKYFGLYSLIFICAQQLILF
jgi:hypothetical protein